MKEEKNYWTNGMLEDLCLGFLKESQSVIILAEAAKDPVLLKRIEAIESSLLQACQLQPSAGLKQKTFQLLESIEAENNINLQHPPFINKYSNLNSWNKAVQSLLPAGNFGSVKVYPLLQDATAEMYVVWLENALEEEGHDENIFVESFFILQGSCECNLGGKIVYLQAGDFLEIPCRTKHNIKNAGADIGYVKAILQRKKIA